MAKITVTKPIIKNFHKNETVSKTLKFTVNEAGLTTSDSVRLRIMQDGGSELVFDETFAIVDNSGTLESNVKIKTADSNDWTVDATYEYQIDFVFANADNDSLMIDEGEFKLLRRLS